MAVGGEGVARAGELHRSVFGGHIHNGEGVFIGIEADFFAHMGCIGAVINDTLGVVGVAIGAKTACKSGAGGVGDVDHVQPPTACGCARGGSDSIGKTCGFIDGNVVDGTDLAIMGCVGKCDRGADHIAELGQIKDLDAVVLGGIGDDEGVVLVHFNVAPDGVGAGEDGVAGKFA